MLATEFHVRYSEDFKWSVEQMMGSGFDANIEDELDWMLEDDIPFIDIPEG